MGATSSVYLWCHSSRPPSASLYPNTTKTPPQCCTYRPDVHQRLVQAISSLSQQQLMTIHHLLGCITSAMANQNQSPTQSNDSISMFGISTSREAYSAISRVHGMDAAQPRDVYYKVPDPRNLSLVPNVSTEIQSHLSFRNNERPRLVPGAAGHQIKPSLTRQATPLPQLLASSIGSPNLGMYSGGKGAAYSYMGQGYIHPLNMKL